MRSSTLVALLGVSMVASTLASTTPEQIHLALQGEAADGASTGMSASWYTQDPTSTATVAWGFSPSDLSHTALGKSVQYLEGHGYHHHATMTNLPHATPVFYSVGDSSGGFSPVMEFMSAPSADLIRFNVSVFGDMGYGKDGNAIETRNRLTQINKEVDWFLHVGDISYADDAFLHYPLEFKYEEVYDNFMNWMQNLTAHKPYMVMPGNHESECHSPACLIDSKYRDGLKNFTAYNARVSMPSEASGGVESMWYSFDYGAVHFVAIDTETDYKDAPEFSHGDSGLLPAGGFAPDGAQMAWLEADLQKAAANRDKRPFIVVSGHRPVYSADRADSNGNPTGDTAKLQAVVEEMFNKYQVDVYFSGHVHSYGRSYPVFQGQRNNNGTVYIVNGGAGCDEMGGKQRRLRGQTLPAWSAYTDLQHYGTGILRVLNSTTMQWQYIHSDDGTVADEIYMHKRE